ncbi:MULTISPECIES: restriction endonuclease subunit S [Clostridium]|uniref:restriction endonuclease subunit S n=1 Tax=Clostridium TaxID=1485 RepID=UPI00069FCD1C|nr:MULTISPECIES: restriction endonuclease subunit S [Clostridium]KOF57482.1 hypothetical protein AGR56_13975 [Clostridium sp. DMHC 10]MCD2348530.1 restriction endonuclease subunit S [Clostridium guangxiense]
MEKNNNKPKLRFPGFTDPWEQRELNECIETSNEKNSDNVYTKEDVLSVSGDFGIVNQIELQGRSFAGASVSNYGVVNTGNIVYTKSPLKRNPFGIIKTNKGKSGIVSTLYAVYKPKENTNPNFVQCYFESDYRLNKYLKPLVNKGAKNDMKVSDDNALLGLVIFPSYEEQTEISAFLEILDNLITLHQRKLNHLQDKKKSLLQKMFPKNGEDFPELRFPGFTDPWERRKVGELLIERNTQAPKSDEYPLMAFVAYEGVAPKGDRYNREFLVSDEDNKKYKQTEYGDFIYSSNNLTTGSIGLNKYGKASISPVYSIFQPTELADSDFIGRVLVRKSFINQMIRWRQGVIYGQWRIHESDFVKMEAQAPSVVEQKQIGDFFNNLDGLIILHQRKLNHLQEQKKALLQQMFV